MPTNTQVLFLVVLVFAVCIGNNEVHAFGAGNIPSFAYMEGRAFRHGDIEDTLAELAKKGAGGFALGKLMGGGAKFGGLDVKRVYFGNWLRDYSQAMDIAGLKKLSVGTIINLCMALGFLAHGYATVEFEVTEERLGVYLPTEHIDNPKGYGEGEDPRKYHPKLRGPVDPEELKVDPRTGMKNYIANEDGMGENGKLTGKRWPTSKGLIRETFSRCIELGRRNRQSNQKEDLYEAYRLLGQGLHTLEDFPAHSNFCELALVKMGHKDVFVQVGDHVKVPGNGRVAPLVTGTFGSSDFIHSLLGEATDHISSASVTDLNKAIDGANTRSRSAGPNSQPGDVLRDLLFNLPGSSGSDMARDMDGINRIRDGSAQGGKRPEDMNPQELHAVLWQVLSFRDSVVKKISMTIEKIPGLGSLIDKLNDSIAVFVFTTLEPFLKPILKQATTGLSAASGEVIDNHDQYEVFNDPMASDPTHSFLSKDHFNLILNEPAGHLAKIILVNAVGLITNAWDDKKVDVNAVTTEILECMFHPDFHNPNSKVQREMLGYMQTWVKGLGTKQQEIIGRLSKEAVRSHKNIRLGGEGGESQATGSYAYNQGIQMQQNIQGYVSGIPGVAQAQQIFGSPQGPRRDMPQGPVSPPGGGMPYQAPSYNNAPPIHSSGESSGYYGGSGPSSPPPPAMHSTYPGQQGGGPAFPSGPSMPDAPNTGYAPQYGSPPPSFPSQPPGGYGGYAPPPGGPPGGPGYSPYGSPPPGPPPNFGGPPPPGQGGYAPPGGYPPQGGYPPPQGGYPPPQGGYPPPQGGYPPPQGYPPQGGYPGQSYNQQYGGSGPY